MEKYYALKLKDENLILNSSSGGAFVSISNYILNNGGHVYASKYLNDSKEVFLSEAVSFEQRNCMCGSIYIQGNISNLVEKIYLDIISNKELALIVGTPCQIDAIRSYLVKKKCNIKNVFFCDLICHGLPSPGFWEKYATYLENCYSGKIDKVNFKSKRDGWLTPKAYCVINNIEISLEPYMRLFYENVLFRESCYQCEYATVERKSDFTIGDYWNVQKADSKFYSPKGVSTVITHTLRGDALINNLDDANLISCIKENVLQPNLQGPTEKPNYYELFWDDLRSNSTEKILRRYVSMKFRDRIFRKIYLKFNKVKVTKSISSGKNKNELYICDFSKCTGCGICSVVCPVSAIDMEKNEKGFFYPTINSQNCIKCGKCNRYCLYAAN